MASFWDFDALPRLLFIRKEWRNMQTVSDYFGSLVFDDRVMPVSYTHLTLPTKQVV